MKHSILVGLLGLAVISLVPAKAGTTGFDFSTSAGEVSGGGNNDISNTTPLQYTLNGITVTAAAYATSAANSSSGGAGDALVSSGGSAPAVGSYYGYGLGVCSAADGTGCPSTAPQHQVDNNGDYEFILFQFSAAVTLKSIVLANYGLPSGDSTIDMDISYLVNPTVAQLTNVSASMTNVFCGDSSEGAANQNATCPTVQGTVPSVTDGSQSGVTNFAGGSMTDTLTGNGITSLLVGAYIGATASPADSASDYFKIQELTVSTPEPATIGMFGLALAGFGLIARKRKRN